LAGIPLERIAAVKLSKVYNLSDFDCDDADTNDFLKNDALVHQDEMIATTILFIYDDKILGFCSLAADAIKLSDDERVECIKDRGDLKHYPQYPALKLARFGRDKAYRGMQIGKNVIIPWVIGYAKNLDEVAIRFITLDAKPKRVPYYEELRFVQNEHKDYKKKEDRPVSMRLDLRVPPMAPTASPPNLRK
jgi:GNAT superfamily N-acetyltransferase